MNQLRGSKIFSTLQCRFPYAHIATEMPKTDDCQFFILSFLLVRVCTVQYIPIKFSALGCNIVTCNAIG